MSLRIFSLDFENLCNLYIVSILAQKQEILQKKNYTNKVKHLIFASQILPNNNKL